MEITLTLFVIVALIAALFQYMSVSMGLGYGTVLTPVLLIIGFAPLQVVPAVLLSQFAGGVIGGVAHHRVRNINLDFRRDDKLIKERLRGLGYLPKSPDAKVIFILTVFGAIGALVGVFSAINIPKLALETYIGIMVLVIGILILMRRRKEGKLSWKMLIGIGLVGSFNKGISGGGYIPLVTGGQLISGRAVKSSVGSTTVAVTFTCAVSFLGYVLIKGDIYWTLVAAASIGSVIAAPFAAMMVKRLDAKRLKFAIGIATSLLGALTLVKAFLL
ncbi:MAG: sulfite exporter TauE/SafE family protein [Chloroflexota bacterium]